MGQLEGCQKIPKKISEVRREVIWWSKRYNWHKTIEKSCLSFTVWPHERSTFKKKVTRKGHFPRPGETDPYRPGKIFEPPFRLNMTNLSQIFLQNNLALYILSNKNFFLPSLVTYRAVRDLISETKKFANSEDLRFANSEDFTFLMPCCIGCSEINKINRHLICSLLPLTSPHL